MVTDLSAPDKNETGNIIDEGSSEKNKEAIVKIIEDSKVLV